MKTFAVIVAALVLAAFAIAPVAAGHASYYENKYAPIPTAAAPEVYATGQLLVAHNLFNQHLDVTGPAGAYEVEIQPAGTFELRNLQVGTYTLTIADGQGGQPETTTIVVAPGAAGRVFLERPLIGHGVTFADPAQAAQRTVTITQALYGKITYTQELVRAAYDEQVLEHAAYVEHLGNKDRFGHGVGQGNGDYRTGRFGILEYVAPIQHAATYTTVHHDAVYQTVQNGAVVDVTAQVQAAVNAGHFALKFDNQQVPGGLFDANTGDLLAQIADPAVGIVKDVHIVADGRTIDAAEYQTITL